MTQKLLLKYPSRLRDLELNILALPANPASFVNILENLRSLRLSFVSLPTIILTNTPFKDLSFARELCDIKIRCGEGTTHVLHAPVGMLFPWSQLSNLTLSSIPISDFSTVLPMCTQLVTCTVSFLRDEEEIDSAQGFISLTKLRTLVINCEKHEGIGALMDLLVTPALKHLTLEGLKEWPKDEVLQLIDRSSCAIEVFQVAEFVIPENDVVSLMRAMPELVEFSAFTSSPTSQETFDSITVENLAPKLQILQGWEVTSLRPTLVFLKSRWNSPERKGIHYAKIWMKYENFHEDARNYESMYPDLEMYGEGLKLVFYRRE